MTIPDEHIPRDTLQQFVSGELGKPETGPVMAHLAECETCLVVVDALWSMQPAIHPSPTDLDRHTAQRIERNLLNRINRNNFAGKILTMGTAGFSNVALALLRPFIETGTQKRVTNKRGSDA